MSNKSWQLGFILLLAIVPIFVFYDIGTRFTEEGVHTGSAENNAAMYPRLVAIIMAGLLAVEFFRTLSASSDSSRTSLRSLLRSLGSYSQSIALFVLFLAYLWSFRWFGFVYATPVFLLFALLVLGYRNFLVAPVFSVGVTAAVYFTFSKILNLALPVGDFFG